MAMKMNKDEQALWTEIERWEDAFFAHETTDLEKSYQNWIDKSFAQLGEEKQQQLLEKVDAVLFQLHAVLQNSRSLDDFRERTLLHAKVFQSDIETIEEMKELSVNELRFLAEQHMAKQRLLALGQGGLAGMGGALLLALDLPALMALQLRSLQQLALTYGYEVKHPLEMMLILKLFHVATLPKAYQEPAWYGLFREIERTDEYTPHFYGSGQQIIASPWTQQLIRQIGKSVVISMLKKKTIQGVPLIGMAFGAGINYRNTRQVLEIGHRFYQKRLLLEKYL
jgi:hypothetical protein